MKNLWFKRKTYGWGWTPSSWEGWVTIIAFIAFEYWNFLRLDGMSSSDSDTVRPFLIQTFLAVSVLLSICYYTGETPRWQWGEPKTKKN